MSSAEKLPTVDFDPAVPAAAQVPTTGGPSDEVRRMMEQDRGKGASSSQSDNLVPLVYILQPLSPQVSRRNPEYIESAEPGAFWLRNAVHQIYPGESGIIAQPCVFSKDWVEWRPRETGGGFVARHLEEREDTCPVGDARADGNKWVRPNGNLVVQTRSHVIRIFTPDGVLPYIIPFSSTGHATSRAWMQLINSMAGAVGFAAKYRLTTRERSNQLGTWFAVDVKFHDWCNKDEYKDGKNLHDAFAKGEKQMETPSTATSNSSTKFDDEIPF